jgi:hypothetical protein
LPQRSVVQHDFGPGRNVHELLLAAAFRRPARSRFWAAATVDAPRAEGIKPFIRSSYRCSASGPWISNPNRSRARAWRGHIGGITRLTLVSAVALVFCDFSDGVAGSYRRLLIGWDHRLLSIDPTRVAGSMCEDLSQTCTARVANSKNFSIGCELSAKAKSLPGPPAQVPDIRSS